MTYFSKLRHRRTNKKLPFNRKRQNDVKSAKQSCRKQEINGTKIAKDH